MPPIEIINDMMDPLRQRKIICLLVKMTFRTFFLMILLFKKEYIGRTLGIINRYFLDSLEFITVFILLAVNFIIVT